MSEPIPAPTAQDTAPTTSNIPTPSIANTTPLDWVNSNLSSFTSQYSNPDDYFQAFLSDLRRRGVSHLENNRNNFHDLRENALTATLIGKLDLTYDISAETNSNGHVDLLLKSPWPGISWKGEAKIIGAEDKYFEGLVKHVAKSNSGRETHALMLGYCKKPDMFLVRAKVLTDIQTQGIADFVNWHTELKSPNSASNHSASGNPLTVHHVWVNCFFETDDELFRRKLGKAPKKKSPKRAEKSQDQS